MNKLIIWSLFRRYNLFIELSLFIVSPLYFSKSCTGAPLECQGHSRGNVHVKLFSLIQCSKARRQAVLQDATEIVHSVKAFHGPAVRLSENSTADLLQSGTHIFLFCCCEAEPEPSWSPRSTAHYRSSSSSSGAARRGSLRLGPMNWLRCPVTYTPDTG